MNNEMLNGSGYKDPTAYKAMRNMLNEERMGYYGWSDGDIVNVNKADGRTQDFLLLKCGKEYATALMLVPNEPAENSLAIRSLSMKYADCGRPAYVFYDRINELIRSSTDEELEAARAAVAKAIGYAGGPSSESTDRRTDVTFENNDTEGLANEIVEKVAEMLTRYTVDQETLTRTKIERDIFKELYEQEIKGVKE